jgi:hypothetical protein
VRSGWSAGSTRRNLVTRKVTAAVTLSQPSIVANHCDCQSAMAEHSEHRLSTRRDLWECLMGNDDIDDYKTGLSAGHAIVASLGGLESESGMEGE